MKYLIMTGVIAAMLVNAGAVKAEREYELNTRDNGVISLTREEMLAFSASLKQLDKEESARIAKDKELSEARKDCLNAKAKTHRWLEDKCVEKNLCKTKDAALKKKYCVNVFKDVQVATANKAANIVETYVVNQLKWEGCAILEVPKSGVTGQDYLECTGPDAGFRIFEFDDISESDNIMASNNNAYALCISVKGKMKFPESDAEQVECTGISERNCKEVLGGSFAGTKCTLRI